MPDCVLYHFSEDPSIVRFVPHVAATSAVAEPLVWALDPAKNYLYLFPRDCPRVTFFIADHTSAADRERFFAHTDATRVVAIESDWLRRLSETKLFRYTLPSTGFEMTDEGAGYWVSREEVAPLSVEPVGDLMTALLNEGVEVRVMPSLWPLYEAVVASTLGFSIIRWRNAAPRPVEERP
jgi:hypothetical protein